MKPEFKYLNCKLSPEVLELVEAWQKALRAYEAKCYRGICERMAEEVDQKIMGIKDDL